MAESSIVCPNCKTPISVNEALSHQVEESLKLKFQQEVDSEKRELHKKMTDWQERVKKEQDEKEESLKKELEANLKKKLLEESDREQKILKEELEEGKVRNKKLMDQLTEITRELRTAKQEKDEARLEMEKKLNEESQKIREKAEMETQEKFHLKEKEKDQVIESLRKSLEDAQRKASQGSQQLQGEVLELELEQLLQKEFPVDDILPVGKGVSGADVMQRIHDGMGRECGVLVWESKRTKTWDEKWIAKLREDTRSAKADVAILVTTVLPKDVNGFGPKDGIYVSDFENALAVAKILRIKIIELCHAKMSMEGKNDKKEILWNYLTGSEFKGRVESIVEAFNLMKDGLNKEKQYFAKKWARDEKIIETVVNQTIGMHGDLQGLMGSSLPEIKSLEMDNFELVQITEVETTTELTDEAVIERESKTTTSFVQGALDDVV